MKNNITIAAALIFLSLFQVSSNGARADNIGGSTYSRYGFGDLRYFTTNRGFAMGGAGIAVLSPLSVDRMNPAAWGALNHTRFSIGAFYEGFSSDDGTTTNFMSKTNFNGLILALPISPQYGVTVTMGITPYSKVNYNILAPQTQQGLEYVVHYLGEGGLTVGHLGTSFKFGDYLYLGAKFNYYFGTITHTVTQTFLDPNLSGAETIRTTSLNGIGMGFGATYTGLNHLFEISGPKSLSIAAAVTTTSWLNLKEDRSETYTLGFVGPNDTTSISADKTPLPYMIALGVAYSTDKILLASDVYYQPWSMSSPTSFNPSELRDNYRVGAGMEILAKRDPLAPFSQRVAYRFGAYYHSSYYLVNNQPINEWGISGGIGVPIWFETHLNIAAQYGWRGTTDFQLQQDKILRLSFSFSVSEPWFNRPPED